MSSNFVNLQHPAPIRQPMFDAKGNLTRPWLLYFIGGGTTAQIVQQIDETVSGSSQLSGFDDFNQRDFAQEIEAAVRLLLSESTGRDWSPEIEQAKLLEVSNAPRDWSGPIEDAENLARETPRAYDDSDLKNALAGTDVPNSLGFQQQIDELRVLIASADVPASQTVLAGGALLAANNLSDVDSVSDARANLGLGNAVTQTIRTITAAATLLATDGTVLCDCTGAAFTATLPASPAAGTILNVKKIDSSANALTIAGTIDGQTNAVLDVQYSNLVVQYDGAGWRVL